MRAVITVNGIDKVGILAKVATGCMNANANIVDVSQTVMDGFFTMTVLVEIDAINSSFDGLKETMKQSVPDMQIRVMHEDIFNSMHRI